MCFMSNMKNSQLSAQCYDVEIITIGSDYVYKLIINNNEGPGEYVICGFTSLYMAVVTGLVGTVSTRSKNREKGISILSVFILNSVFWNPHNHKMSDLYKS